MKSKTGLIFKVTYFPLFSPEFMDFIRNNVPKSAKTNVTGLYNIEDIRYAIQKDSTYVVIPEDMELFQYLKEVEHISFIEI